MTNYSFLVYFEFWEILKCKENSGESICQAIKAAVGEDQLRNIILKGMKCFDQNQTKDFKIISKIHQQFIKEKFSKECAKNRNLNVVESKSNDNSNNDYNSNNSVAISFKPFEIQSITSKILSYLDLQSFFRCNRLSKQWLYDSYCVSSIYYLNYNWLLSRFRYDEYGTLGRNLNRFRHVSSLTIDLTQLQVHCQDHDGTNNNNNNHVINKRAKLSLRCFGNLKKLSINLGDLRMYRDGRDQNEYQRKINGLIMDMINDNENDLQVLEIGMRNRNINNTDITFTTAMKEKKWTFPKLERMRLARMKLGCFYLSGHSNGNNNNNNNNNNSLQALSIDDSVLFDGFWKDLANKSSNLSKLRSLTLCRNTIKLTKSNRSNKSSKSNESNESNLDATLSNKLAKEYIPQIALKLTNIEELMFAAVDTRIDSKIDIRASLLSNLCGTRLRILFIQLNPIAVASINDHDIKCNFKVLKHAGFEFGQDKQQNIHVAVTNSTENKNENENESENENENNENNINVQGSLEKNVQGSIVISRILRMISVPIPVKEQEEEEYEYSRVCNVKSLWLRDLERLHDLPTVELYYCLNTIKFSRLRELQLEEECDDNDEQVYLTTKQLLNWFDSIDIKNYDSELDYRIRKNICNLDLCIEMEFEAKEHIYQPLKSDLISICNHLAKWYIERPHRDLILRFEDNRCNENVNEINFDFPYQFSISLINELNKVTSNKWISDDGSDSNFKKLKSKQFTSPYYDGNSYHFLNKVKMFDDRVELKIHLQSPIKYFDFIVAIKSRNTAQDPNCSLIGDECQCVVKPAILKQQR